MRAKLQEAKGGRQKTEMPRKYPRIDERAAANFVSLQEIVATARRNLPQDLWDHLSGGSDSETTLLRNRQALDSLALRQRVLVDVRKIDITTTLLGQKLASPVFLAPVGGFVGFAHPLGAVNVAKAAVAHGTTAFISTAAKPSLEAAAAAVKEPLIFQLYVRADRKWVEDILDRAKAAGYRALCVCVDRNYYGRRERDIISRANVREGFGDPTFQMGLKWDDLAWMKSHWKVPLIVKGIAARTHGHERAQWIASEPWTRSHRHLLAFALTLGVNVFYVLAVGWLGFVLTGTVYLAALFAVYGVQARWVVPLALVSTLVIHTAFYKLLRVPLPWGLLQPILW